MIKVNQSSGNVQKTSQAVSRETGDKFREMLQVMGAQKLSAGKQTNRKEANGKEAGSKEAEVNPEATSKEAGDKEVDGKEAQSAEGNLEKEDREVITRQGSKRTEGVKEERREAIVREDIIEQGSAEIIATVSSGNALQRPEMTETLENAVQRPITVPTEAVAKDSLEKQIDHAHLLKPRIEFNGKEAMTVEQLEEEIGTRSDKDVEIVFGRKPEEEQGSKIQPIHAAAVEKIAQGSESREAEKIFIKVAEPNEIVPKVIEELKEKIVISQVAEKSYEIELDPQNLGKIFVKVTFHKNETALEMMFSSKKTMELMARNIDHLTEGLQASKSHPVSVQMNEQTSDYLEQQEKERSGQSFHQQKEQQRKSEEFLRQMKESMERELAI